MNENEATETLYAIVDNFGGLPEKGRVEFWGMLAAKLSRVVSKTPEWDWRYPAQIYSGKQTPSKKFIKAVEVMVAALDGLPVVIGYTVEVRVFAKPGSVADGSLVLGQSKPCARPGCPVKFVPNVPWRRYCSDECYIKAKSEKA